MKARYSKLLGALAAVLTLLATVLSSTACWWWGYQPKTPKALQKIKV